MIVELGHFALTLAFGVALVQFAAPILGLIVAGAPRRFFRLARRYIKGHVASYGPWTGNLYSRYALLFRAVYGTVLLFRALIWALQRGSRLRRYDNRLLKIADAAALVVFALIAFSFAALIWAHVADDFSVANVWENSHSAKPLIYKISGVWGNHEGSMLLWILILAIFGAAVSLTGRNLPLDLRAMVLAVQGSISATFAIFIVATSNPFLRMQTVFKVPEAPTEGNGLNPILQDVALAIHPPLLYIGYVGFSMAFSFAIAALVLGRIDSAWARWVRPWTLAAWIFLTLGIGVGSWWAYYTLGWGGWWFWDPVENASLMPWLTGTALLHSAIVMEKRDSLKAWTVLLAILTFSLSLLGTFLVRSGVINSVHSFASDPARGLFILMIVGVFTAGGLGLFGWRASSLNPGSTFAVVSREAAIVLNNLLLSVCCGIVFCGTLYPLVTEALGYKITVGAPFYNLTAVWFFLLLLLAVPFGMFLAWKRGDLHEAAHRLWPAAVVAFIAGAGAAAAWAGVKITLAIALGAWVLAGSVWEVLWRAKFLSVPLAETARRLGNMRRSQYAATLGHIGLAVSVIGVAGASAWNSERLIVMKPGESSTIAGYTVTFKRVFERQGPNYVEMAGDFELRRGDKLIGSLIGSKRRYDAPPRTTTQAGISQRLLGDVYVVLGNEAEGGGFSVRMYFHPFVRWIWGGAVLMFIAGLLSLFDRRLRIGLPQRAAKTPAALAPEPVK